MICPNCKKEIDDKAKFCPECGSKIEIVEEKVDKTETLEKEAKEETLENNEIVSDVGAEENIEEKADEKKEPSPKSRLAAALLALVFGWSGAHRFYLQGASGNQQKLRKDNFGLLQLIVSIVSAVAIGGLCNDAYSGEEVLKPFLLSFYCATGICWFFWDFAFILAGKLKDLEKRPVTKWRPKNSGTIATYVFSVIAVFSCLTPLFLKMHKDYVYKHSQDYFLESIEKGDIKAVKELINYGIDVNERGWTGESYFRHDGYPLESAVKTGNLAIVELIIAAGANVNKTISTDSLKNYTALFLASSYGYAAIAKYLIENGATIDIKVDDYKWEKEERTEEEKKYEKSNELLEKGKWVYDGFWTPLMIASAHNHVDVIKVLLDNGAELMIKNNYGNTAIDLARYNNAPDAETVLLRYRRRIYGW